MNYLLYSAVLLVQLGIYLCQPENNWLDICAGFEKTYRVFSVSECLIFTSTKRTWHESKLFCENLCPGSSMVQKINPEKQDVIGKTLYSYFGTETAWIGLRRCQQKRCHRWESGDKFASEQWLYPPETDQPETSKGMCVSTAGEQIDRSGWRHQHCNNSALTICQIDIERISSQPTSTSISVSPVTSATSSSSCTTTTTTSSAAMSTSSTTIGSSTTVTAVPTSTSATEAISGAISTSYIVSYINSSEETDKENQLKESPKESVFVIAGVVICVLLFLTGVIIVFWRRQTKRRRDRDNNCDYSNINSSGNDNLENTHGPSECVYAVTGSTATGSQKENIRYDHIMADSAKSQTANVAEQTYDTANVNQGRQLQPTVDGIYDRAIFKQSETTTDNDVYDHTQVTLMTPSVLNKKNILSHYDHAFVQ